MHLLNTMQSNKSMPEQQNPLPPLRDGNSFEERKRPRSLSQDDTHYANGHLEKKHQLHHVSNDTDSAIEVEYHDKDNDPVPFIAKLYALVNHCHSECPQIACWSAEGKTFVVKDKDEFAKTILPQYFDHNKFSSLVRQLNFYGFSKMQTKEIRNSDVDKRTINYVSFYNKNFISGREELLKNVRRSTEGQSKGEQKKEIEALKVKVEQLEKENKFIKEKFAQFEESLQYLMKTTLEDKLRSISK